MEREVTVVYENGVLKLLEPVTLSEGERFRIMVPEHPQPPKQRVLDMYPGAFQISDDFDDPLPDEFWLGENPDEESY